MKRGAWLLLFCLAAQASSRRPDSYVVSTGLDSAETGALLVRRGDDASWREGCRLLVQSRHPLARVELEKVLDSLPQKERAAAAANLASDPAAPAALLEKLAMDEGAGAVREALQALGASRDPGALDALERLGWSIQVSDSTQWIQQRRELEWLGAFTRQFYRRFEEETGFKLYSWTARDAIALGLTRTAGLDLMESWIQKASLNGDWRFHYDGPLEKYPHPRAADVLLKAARADPAGPGGQRALVSLLRRGDLRVLEEVMEAAVAKDAASRYVHDYGEAWQSSSYFGEAALLPIFERLLKEPDARRRWMWYRALAGTGYTEDPATLAVFKAHLADPRPEVRRAVEEALAWPRLKRIRIFKAAFEEHKGGLRALASSLLALAAGLLVFLLAFRVLKLRALLSTLQPAPAGALAQGLARLSGEAQPATGYLKHPDTGELCLYYPGADKQFPGHRFYLCDQSGRVLVQPRGGLLLGGDSVITPGEALTVVGFASPSGDPAALGAGPRPMALGKAKETPTLKQRLLRLLLKALLGSSARAEAVRMLFADPRDFFFIWEDQARQPLSAPGTRFAAMAAMALAGLWSLVFFTLSAATATQKLDELILALLGLLAFFA